MQNMKKKKKNYDENLTVRNKTLQHSNTEVHQLFIT